MEDLKVEHGHQIDKRVLGLDVGVGSVGAALLAEDTILALHVRAFDKAETADKGESLNKERRDARSVRRRLRRRAHRLERLRRLFARRGLLSGAEADALKPMSVSPWTLRAEGLDRKLSREEWAATLYHMVKHRGFQSNRKSEAAEDEKVGKMLSAVSEIKQKLEASEYRTVGELMARDSAFERKRNKLGDYSHTLARADILDEIDALFEVQRAHGNPTAGKDLQAEIRALLLARRPTLSGDDLLKMVGRCTFEPDEDRAPKACYTTEQFLWLTKLNNLRIIGVGKSRPLTTEERSTLIDKPFTKASISYAQVRTWLKLGDNERFSGLTYPPQDSGKNPEKTNLFTARAYHALKRAYVKHGLDVQWENDRHDATVLDHLGYALTVYKEDDQARDYLHDKGVDDKTIEAALTVSFDGFAHLSLKALRRIEPFMREGQRYDEAVVSAGYAHHSDLRKGDKRGYLPRLSRREVPNPVVYRALNQARKVINAMIREYGMPDAIHIELARDLNQPFDERKRIQREQLAYRDRKEDARTDFIDHFGFEPKGRDLLKWQFYRQQDGKCGYSVTDLDINRLFETGYCEIDHALPYSRSFDDSLNNKVLVKTAENRNKGNRTPYEYMDGASDSEQWRRFVAFVTSNKKFRQAKRNRLLRKDFTAAAADGFRDRHLNDTRYIAKLLKREIETHLPLGGGGRCVVVSGQLTAFLRARWGLLKVREDGDKHHALDAAVVAACTRGMVKRLADYSRKRELEHARTGLVDPETGEIIDIATLRQLENEFPTPWHHFRQELKARLSDNPQAGLTDLPTYPPERLATISPIRVSRPPRRRGLGAAHQETIRSAKRLSEGVSTVKTPLTKLKLKDVPNIVGADDPRNAALIAAIRQRLEAHGDKPEKAFLEPLHKPSKPGKTAPVIRSVRVQTVQKSGLPVRDGIANNGDMLRTDVFHKGGKFYVVPVYVAHAAAGALPSRAVVAYKPEDEWPVMDESYEFLFSVYPYDWLVILLKGNKKVEGYFAGLNRSNGSFSVWAHDRHPSVGKEGMHQSIGVKTAKAVTKYHVDVLGRLHKVAHEVRKPLV